MISRVVKLMQGKVVSSAQTNHRTPAMAIRVLANDLPRRRSGHPDHHRPTYSPFFFMALIVTVISSVAFVSLLSVAIGAG